MIGCCDGKIKPQLNARPPAQQGLALYRSAPFRRGPDCGKRGEAGRAFVDMDHDSDQNPARLMSCDANSCPQK